MSQLLSALCQHTPAPATAGTHQRHGFSQDVATLHTDDGCGADRSHIVRRYPNQWGLVAETAWDARAYPTAGIVRAASVSRRDLREPLRRCHHDTSVKTFLFYTGDAIPTDLTVVL